MESPLSATPAVLTVELESEVVAAGAVPPEPLTRDAAEVLAAAIGADLQRIVGDVVGSAGLVVPGALYDLTELLRPRLPMREMLLEVYRSSLRGAPFDAHMLALGSAAGRFPLPELAPARAPGSGPMLAVPFALVAPGRLLDDVQHRLERDLLEKGRASADTDRIVRQQFGVAPVHLTYATLHDLSAMLKVQLEYAGFAGLWQLIESGLYRPHESVVVDLPEGNRFLARNGRVWTPVVDFDGWVDRHTSDADPLTTYAAWQKGQRQYMAGLAAHGLEVNPVRPEPGVFDDAADTAIAAAQRARLPDPVRFTVPVSGAADAGRAAVVTLTEQRAPKIGPFAYTVLVQGDSGDLLYLGHEYPLAPQAVAAIRDGWAERAQRQGATFRVERPQHAVIAGDPPRLHPWLDYEGRA